MRKLRPREFKWLRNITLPGGLIIVHVRLKHTQMLIRNDIRQGSLQKLGLYQSEQVSVLLLFSSVMKKMYGQFLLEDIKYQRRFLP